MRCDISLMHDAGFGWSDGWVTSVDLLIRKAGGLRMVWTGMVWGAVGRTMLLGRYGLSLKKPVFIELQRLLP